MAPGALNSLSHSSDVVLDTEKPTPLSATVTAQGGNIDVFLSEALTPASLDDLDSGEFTLDGTSAVVREVITFPNTPRLILVLTDPEVTDPDDPNIVIIQPGEIVTLAWAADNEDSITDAAGNVLSDFSGLSVTNDEQEVPVVALVTPADFAQYHKAGDEVNIVVTFTTSVTVTGIPQLTLDIDGSAGSAVGAAQYVSGPPGADLVFRYSVVDGHNTAALGYPSVNALSLNGGSIQSTATPTLAADLTLPEPGAPNSLSGNFFGPVVIDTIAPAVPVIDDPVTGDGDNRITAAERNVYGGVLITGSRDADVDTTLTLCFGATDPTDPLCTGGRTYDPIAPVPIFSTATTFVDAASWSYLLDVVEITELAGISSGTVTLTAIAADAAGNTAVSSVITISVDAIKPPGIDTVANDNIINATERTDGVTIIGTHDAALSVTLCVGGTYDPTPLPTVFIGGIPDPAFSAKEFLDSLPGQVCAGGVTYAAEGGLGTTFVVGTPTVVGMPVGTTWSVELGTAAIPALDKGSVTLTAIAFDTLGGVTVSPVLEITVDTVAPTADSARVNAGGTNIVVSVSEPLVLTNLDGTEFTLTGDTTAQVIAVSTDGTELRLSIDTAIQSGDSVGLTWSPGTGDSIADTAGNILEIFNTPVPVTIINVAPAFDTPIAGDNRINLAEREADDGVTITGTRVRDATVTLCIGGSDDICTGGTTRDTTSDTPTTWRYTLTAADHALMPDGTVNLRATAVVEGLSGTISQDITVDTSAPGMPTVTTPIDDDNIIIGYSDPLFDIEFIVEGTKDADSSMTLCIGATDTTDPTCAGGSKIEEDDNTTFVAFDSPTATSWSFTLNAILVSFGPVTLTAIATDAAGNTAVSESVVITVISPIVDPALTAVSAVANADGTSITVTLSEPVTLTDTLDGSEFTLSGTSASVNAVSPSGLTLILSLDPAIQSGERVTLAYTAGDGDIIADVNGNAMSDFTNLLVVTSTAVVVEASAADGFYKDGDSVPITVTFSDVVTVTGTPQLALNTGGAGNGTASYASGSGTTSLIFTYSVRLGDNIGDLAYTDTSALSGNIDGATAVNLTLPTPGDANSLSGSSNVVLDNTAPAAPTFDAVGASGTSVTGNGNRLNAADRSAGVLWGGGVESGATVTLCLAGGGDGSGASCGVGRTFRTAISLARSESWVYTLPPVDIAAMGEGAETVTATATDAAGNVSDASSYELIVDTVAPVFISGNSGAVAVNSDIAVIAYDANAIDNGGVADVGITYRLGGPLVNDVMTFTATRVVINEADGVVTYKAVQNDPVTDNIVIIATDLAGNTATQAVALSVVSGVTVTITDDVTTAADVAADDVTFSFNFSEDVTGFDVNGITVGGGDKGTFGGSGRTYTLVVTLPTAATNDGTLTVTVAVGVATGASGTNDLTTDTQDYDTQAPAAPGIVATIAGDNTINIAERDEGVEVSGTNEAEAGITLCAGVTPATDPTCAGGTTFPVTVAVVGSATTTWSYTLTADDISAIGNRTVTLTAIAADAAGNTAVSTEDISITVDTVAPPTPAIDVPVADDNTFNATERVTGTKETGVGVTLCFGATDAADINCVGGTTFPVPVAVVGSATTTWSYAPTTDQLTTIPQGEVTLTAIAVDAAGNKAVSPGHDITVDTIAPDFTSGTTGSVGLNSATTAIAYDAEATDNDADGEVADEAITYTLSGDDAGMFNIDEGSGEVRYNDVQTTENIHNIIITATDAAGNTATQPVTISVRNAPTVTITDNFAGDYADGLTAITFTYTFSEPVTGFIEADVEVTADSAGAIIQASNFNEVTAGRVYTQDLLFYGGASPNDGTVTVRVPADSVAGTLTPGGNLEATATQSYDSVNPARNALAEVTLAFDVAGGTTEVYNAGFTDGAAADVGIAYSLTDAVTGSGHAALFTLNPDSGSVTFIAIPSAATTYDIVITGEDKASRSESIRLTINAVTLPTVVSVRATDGFHTDGGSVPITVTFSEAVTVATTGGIPLLALTTGNSAGPGNANYTGGSGSTALTFTYSVSAADNSRDLAYAGITALRQNGGAIQNAAATVAADLTLPVPGTAGSLSVTSTVVLDNTEPVFTPASAADNRIPVPAAIASDTTSEIYNADATDVGRAVVDAGITYALAGTDALTFTIDPNSGVLTPAVTLDTITTYTLEITAADEVNNVATQYLSVVVFDRPVVTITDSIEAGTPATRRTDSVNLADSGVTFTFEFTEMVTDFDTDDIMVTGGGSKGAFTITDPGMAYTVVATPTSNTNGGVLTVTVRADAVTGTVTGRTSAETSYTQDYDRLRPTIKINAVAGDDIININEQTDTITGTISEAGTLVTLCFGGTNAACTDGTTATAGVNTFAWSYTLTAADVDELGEGDNILLRATAIDGAGNSGEGTRPITVDTVAPIAPTFAEFISGQDDNLITAAERAATNGVTINGDVGAGEPGASVSLCFGGTDDACTGGMMQDAGIIGTAWSYTLTDADYTALGQGTVTVRATTTDAAFNIGATRSKGFSVDTILPVFSSGASGVVGVDVPITATAYDAEATDNGLASEVADDGITYTLGGADSDQFNIDADSGVVRYKVSEADPIIHNITIIATDTAGNSSDPFVVRIEVRGIPTVEITDNVAGVFATGADLTFTFTFREEVDDFTVDDIRVLGGSFDTLNTTIAGRVYTLVVTPHIDNYGTVIVTVIEDAVRSVVTGNANIETSVSQRYDSVVPVFAVGATDTATLVLGDPIGDAVYDAAATDDGGVADAGISYTLSGTETVPFVIDGDSGEVTYRHIIPNIETDYAVEITATDKGGNTAVVTVTVTTVLSSNADLARLLVAPSLASLTTLIPITPDFDADTTAYTANVGAGVTQVGIVAPPVRLLGTEVISGTAADGSGLSIVSLSGTTPRGSREVSGLTEGDNLITIVITAPDGNTTLDPNDGTQKTYTLTINVVSAPAFAGTIAAQTYTVGQPVSLSLPTAGGGLLPLSYTLTPAPAGLTFSDDGTTRLLAGTPTKDTAASLTYTATDNAGMADALIFMVTVNAVPAFDDSAIPLPAPAYTYIANQRFTVTLPPASGGTAPLTYTLTPFASIPAGLIFDATATARTLSGTPTGATISTDLTYTATDANGAAITAVFSLSGGFNPATVTSVSATDGIYTEGDSVLITIAFSETVTVDITGGVPQLALTTGNSGDNDTANYASGSGSTALTFTYPVIDGDDTGDLAYSGTTALSLNSGTILNAVGNIAATLTLPAVGDANSLSDSSAVVLDNSAPVFTRASAIDNRALVPVSIDTVAASVFYNADARDRGRAADTGITYTVVGIHALSFAIDSLSGALSPTVTLATVATFSIEITATDEFNKAATQYLSVSVVDDPVVEITDNIAAGTIANIADGALTFTFEFKEKVTGFDESDISVGGGSTGTDAFATIVDGMIYTLVATPTSNINVGVLTVTVAADAATAATSTGTKLHKNIETMWTQEYDTLAPVVPTFDIVATDNIINAAEQTAELTGTTEAATTVTLCFGGTDDACDGGTSREASVAAGTTTWRYTLVEDDITAIGEGDDKTLRATATDTAGNTSLGTHDIRVDTVIFDPTIRGSVNTQGLGVTLIAGDDTINAAERDAGVDVVGRIGMGLVGMGGLILCAGATDVTDPLCAGGMSYTASFIDFRNWVYDLTVADINTLGDGDVTLTAIATDTAGNTAVSTGYDITVDTTVPVFTSGRSGAVAVGATSTTVTAYDADATNNGGATENADDGITYTLSSGDVGLFNIDEDSGEVTYKAVQTSVTLSPHHVIITATDTAGNTATQEVTISVLDAPAVIITDSVTSVYTNAAVTFTFSFSEGIEAGGFATDDITVGGGDTNDTFMAITPNELYTLVVTPTTNTNDGILTVTVRVDAVMGTTTKTGNPVMTAFQEYDTVAPMLVDGDNMDGDGDDGTDTAMVVVNDDTDTVVYDANATDGSGAADEGITYTLSGTGTGTNDNDLFNIDEGSGEVTYKDVQSSPTTDPHHAIIITATDKGGNTDTIGVTVIAVFSSDSGLSALTVATSDGVDVLLSPDFDAATLTYTASVVQEVTSVTITTTSRSDAISVTFAGTAADGNTLTIADATATGATVSDLTDGVNTITITVTAADGTTVYTIDLTRAPPLTFGDSVTIDGQIYPINQDIVLTQDIEVLATLTLPEASGDSGGLSYTLTPEANIPAGLMFDPATRIFSGTPTALETRTLTYRVTDGALPPVSAELTFSVMIVREKTVKPTDITVVLDLNLDNDESETDTGNAILILPSDHKVTKATLSAPSETAINNPPAGIEFVLTTATDIAIDMPLAANTIVCLPTTGVPPGSEPVLYHYAIASVQTDESWNAIGRNTTTHVHFVCGETDTFSPFAVGYETSNIAETTTRLHEQILTRAAQAMTASTLEAVARRVDAVADGAASSAGSAGATPALAYQFGGQSSLSGLLKSHGKAMLEDNMEYEQLFDGASFVVPLSATEGGTGDGKPGAGTLSLWGSSNFINLDSDNDELDWDGRVTSINVGVDRLVGEDMLAGFALSSNQSGFDYVDSDSNDARR